MAAQITALPTPPTRQDSTNFNDRADAFLAALPGFQSEANALSTEVNTRADNVQASDLAVLAATNITKWVSGTTYAEGAVVWSPINGLGYRRITASGSGTTDPSSDSTNYRQVNGTGNVSTDINGNLGIGVTPKTWFANDKAIQISGGAVWADTGNNTNVNLSTNSYQNSSNTPTYIGAGRATIYKQELGAHVWYTSSYGQLGGDPISFSYIMSLDADKNLLFGTGSTSVTFGGIYMTPGTESEVVIGHGSGAGFGSKFISFRYSNSSIGSITRSGTTGVSYNTSSDYRLKHDISPMQNALHRISALKPCIYKWNTDNSDGEGFIAHELAEVCPSAVTGEKDAVDADGKPIYQGIDTSFLVATLVAAIQEQQLLITSLTSRIEALESALPK